MEPSIKRHMEALDAQLGTVATAAKTGRLGNITLRAEMLPSDVGYADALVYITQLIKHYCTLYSRGLLPETKSLSISDCKRFSERFKIIAVNYSEQVFTTLYPTSARIKAGKQRIWLQKPWLAEGLSSQVAMFELSMLALKKLYALKALDGTSVAAELTAPLVDIITDIVVSNYSPKEIERKIPKLKYHVPLETPPVFLAKIAPERRTVLTSLPTRHGALGAVVKSYLVELVPTQTTLVGTTLKPGDLFKIGQQLYLSKKRQTMLSSIDTLSVHLL